MCVCVCFYIYICVCAYIYIYIYIPIHTLSRMSTNRFDFLNYNIKDVTRNIN